MKKLVMSALLIGAVSQAAGCVFVSDDDVPAGVASVDVTWNLNDGNPDFEGDDTDTCPGTTAIVYAQAGSAAPYSDLFDCVDGGGIAMDLPLGTYTVWVDFNNGLGTALLAQSEAATINLTSDGQRATAVYEVDVSNGFFDVAWQFDGGASSCADAVGETGVSVLSTIAGTTDAFDDLFDCEAGAGTTAALPLASYVVVVDAINASNQSLGSSGPMETSIDYGNEFVDLGLVNIVLN